MSFGYSQNTVDVDVSASWKGYLNASDNPDDSTPDCGGGFCFGDFWALADLKTTIGASTITLQPNFNLYNATDVYWANGAIGNKMTEASTFVEPGATFNGEDLIFTGKIVSHNLDLSRYSAKVFIKALDPGNGYADVLGRNIDIPLSGTFSISATAAELATGFIVQYGFVIYGLNANPVDEAAFGSVVVESATASIKDYEIPGLAAYPNPSNNKWTISTKDQEIQAIEVFNVIGKRVLSVNPNALSANVDASSLSPGVYIATITTEKGTSSRKLIKN